MVAAGAGLRTAMLVAALAFAARLLAQLWLGFYVEPERFEHDDIARNILAGRGYIFDHNGTAWKGFATPLYPLLLTAVYAPLGPSPLAAGVTQALLGVVLALAILRLGTTLAGPATGTLAGLATAVHPGLLVYAAKIHPLGLDATLAALAMLTLLPLSRSPKPPGALAVGIIGGLVTLARPTLLLFMGVAALVAVLRSRRRQVAKALLLASCIVVVVVAPWLLRNWVVADRVALSTSVGEVFWIGNNPLATGSALTEERVPMLEASPRMRQAVWGRDENEQDAIFWATALVYVAEDPLRTARAYATKLLSFWWFSSRSGALYPSAWLTAYQTYYVGVLIFAVAGAFVLVRAGRRWELALLLLPPFMVSLVQSAFFVEGRHRWEVESLLLVLGAAGLIATWRRWGPRSRDSDSPHDRVLLRAVVVARVGDRDRQTKRPVVGPDDEVGGGLGRV